MKKRNLKKKKKKNQKYKLVNILMCFFKTYGKYFLEQTIC